MTYVNNGRPHSSYSAERRIMQNLPSIHPIIPKKKSRPFDDDNWIFDLKYDGFRGLLYHDGKSRLFSRRGKRLQFPELEEKLSRCFGRHRLILDGEVVSLDESGHPIFYNLIQRQGSIVYVAFDLLWLDGRDLRKLALLERKSGLDAFARLKHSQFIRRGFSIRARGLDFFDTLVKKDLEGMVAKRSDSPYMPRTEWLKILNPSYSQTHARFRTMRS